MTPTTREIRRSEEICKTLRPQLAALLTKLLIGDKNLVPTRAVLNLCASDADKQAAHLLIGRLRGTLKPFGIEVALSPGYWLSGPIQLCHPSKRVDVCDKGKTSQVW